MTAPLTKWTIVLSAAVVFLGAASSAMAMVRNSADKNAQIRAVGSAHQIVFDDNGNVTGRDPDPLVRLNLRRSAGDRNR